jgi:hypothetical protein
VVVHHKAKICVVKDTPGCSLDLDLLFN